MLYGILITPSTSILSYKAKRTGRIRSRGLPSERLKEIIANGFVCGPLCNNTCVLETIELSLHSLPSSRMHSQGSPVLLTNKESLVREDAT